MSDSDDSSDKGVPAVVEFGSSLLRAGHSNTNTPTVVIPNVVSILRLID
jgi:actin-related protein